MHTLAHAEQYAFGSKPTAHTDDTKHIQVMMMMVLVMIKVFFVFFGWNDEKQTAIIQLLRVVLHFCH